MKEKKEETFNRSVLQYLNHINTTDWILNEAYKFEFANYLQSDVEL